MSSEVVIHLVMAATLQYTWYITCLCLLLGKLQYVSRGGVAGTMRYTAHSHGLVAEDLTPDVMSHIGQTLSQQPVSGTGTGI